MNTGLAAFHGETEIRNQTDLQSLTGKTLRVEAGSAPTVGDSPSTILRQCINLQLLNTGPQECFKGTVALSCSKPPLGQSGLAHHGFRYEVAKVFGLWSRKLNF